MKINMLSNHYQNPLLKPLEVVLLNRGFATKEEMCHFMHPSDSDINSPRLLGEENLKQGIRLLFKCINNNKKAIIVIDADTDGYTSAACLANYLFQIFPSWTKNKLSFFIHEKKIHGLTDCYKQLAESDKSLIICPDSASSDYEQINYLYEKGKEVLVLDHHPSPKIADNAVIINNQLCNYPNKALSGVGVVWQFCKFIDEQFNVDYAEDFLDLVALGLVADVMSLAAIETKYLIQKGLRRIRNPLIEYMIQRNNRIVNIELTPFNVSFYIAPLFNAMTRTGTIEEQAIVFKALLEYKAHELIPSTKKSCQKGELEMVYQQAFRIMTNVKNRQNKMQEAGQRLIEQKIEQEQLLHKHKILMILLQKEELSPALSGLIANKIMSKYQRPVCILTKSSEDDTYNGSARNYDRNGFTNFKQLCADTGLTEFQMGHPNAFGLSIAETKISDFLKITDDFLSALNPEAVYNCDFAIDIDNVCEEVLADIADNEGLWGKDVERPLFFITGIKIFPDSLRLMKADTLQIKTIIPIIKFRAKDIYENLFVNTGYKKINIVAEAASNIYMGEKTYQLKLIDYEIVEDNSFYF